MRGVTRSRCTWALVSASVCAGFCLAPPAAVRSQDHFHEHLELPLEKQAYLGIIARDGDDGPVVGFVLPGPLGGTGQESTAGVRRGDNLVSVRKDLASYLLFRAADLDAAITNCNPGERIVLTVRRSPEAVANAAMPIGGRGGEETEYEVVLGSRAEWTGTIARGLRPDARIPEVSPGEFEERVLAAAGRASVLDAEGSIRELLPYLDEVQHSALDANSLPAVVRAFRRPLALDRIEAEVAAAAHAVAPGRTIEIVPLLRQVLDLQEPEVCARSLLQEKALPRHVLSRTEIAAVIRRAAEELLGSGGPPEIAAACKLVRWLRDNVSVGGADAKAQIGVIAQSGMQATPLLERAITLLRFAPEFWEDAAKASVAAGGADSTALPEAARAAVRGDVIWCGQIFSEGFAVIGGPGVNHYDVAHFSAIYDLGGDDTYSYRGCAASRIPLRTIVDVAGNDLHESTEDFAGPGTACFGVSVLDDRAGNDTYRGTGQFSVGAGLFGCGILVDRSGSDRYENIGAGSGWSLGVGFYGAGLIFDGGGNDLYLGEKLVQGVGGPRGFGAIIDREGNDLYRANGPSFPSAYGTPGVFLGMAQGFGFGIRNYAAGGLGALFDCGGDDRYEGGEFSQAGGYYFGLGILHDTAGNDLYYGNRYGQGFAAHQAVGILVDGAGDDHYWSMTAASQGAAWDQSIAMLIDRSGNDCYRSDGLAQGAAAMQAFALQIDAAGCDRYDARGDAAQGACGDNSYHFESDGIFSFAMLLDLGGASDIYSSGRANGAVTPTGRRDDADPKRSNLYGVCDDE